MKRRDFIKMGAGLGATMATTTPLSSAFAQTKMILKASDVHPLGYPTVKSRPDGQETGSRHQRPADDPDVSVDAARRRKGNHRAGADRRDADRPHAVGAVGPIVDDINVVNMPFLFQNSKHMEKVIDGEIGQELLDKITAKPKSQPDGAVLDERRLAQPLQQQAPDQDHCRSQGPQGPHDGQSDVHRHDECARRQRRRDGLRSGVQLDADRRHRWRGKQSAIVHRAEPLSGGQVFHDDRAPDHSELLVFSRIAGKNWRWKIRR